MGFVLVPVPTEHVLDVMRWVLFRADDEGAGRSTRDTKRVIELLAETTPETRSLLGRVAEATLRDESLRLLDLADELERPSGEVSAAIEALNDEALEGERLLLEVRAETVVGVTGQKGRTLYVAMRPLLARVVRHALREVAS